MLFAAPDEVSVNSLAWPGLLVVQAHGLRTANLTGRGGVRACHERGR
jgi:hypothetical protein